MTQTTASKSKSGIATVCSSINQASCWSAVSSIWTALLTNWAGLLLTDTPKAESAHACLHVCRAPACINKLSYATKNHESVAMYMCMLSIESTYHITSSLNFTSSYWAWSVISSATLTSLSHSIAMVANNDLLHVFFLVKEQKRQCTT